MALTGNQGSLTQAKFGNIQAYTCGAAIWRGAVVVVRLTDGLVYPAADDTTDTYKQVVVGHAVEQATAAGATIRVRQDGKLRLKFPGVTQAAVGKLACVKDDETVQLYSLGQCAVVVGRITEMLILNEEVLVDFTQRPARLATSEFD